MPKKRCAILYTIFQTITLFGDELFEEFYVNDNWKLYTVQNLQIKALWVFHSERNHA